MEATRSGMGVRSEGGDQLARGDLKVYWAQPSRWEMEKPSAQPTTTVESVEVSV